MNYTDANAPIYSTNDLITASADLFDDPETVLTEYGSGIVQTISTLIGLPSDHFYLVLMLIQKEVTIQELKGDKNTLTKRLEILETENGLLRTEIQQARNEIRELV